MKEEYSKRDVAIKELEDKLYKYKIEYYKGHPILDDHHYDLLEKKLKKWKPNSYIFSMVGAPIPGKNKAKHMSFMGSLDNAMNLEEFTDWYEKMVCNHGYEGVFSLTDKIDGFSIELIYNYGRLMQAITRGDGTEGQDVTRNVFRCKGLVTNIKKFNMSVKAEGVVTKNDFIALNKILKDNNEKLYSNPRNAAAGIIQREDGKYSDYITIIAYSCFIKSHEFESEYQVLNTLKEMGFIVPDDFKLFSVDDAKNILDLFNNKRNSLDYCVDGVVAKINSIDFCESLGYKDNRPVGQIAFKFEAEGEVSILLDVVMQVGQTGIITPVAKIEPVNIGGAVVESPTLHNFQEIERLGIKIGDMIKVIRSGDVIPKIVEVVEKGENRQDILIPGRCPECDGDVDWDGAHLKCINDDCCGRAIGRIKHWVHCRNIMHLNKGIIEKLFENDIVEKVSDLYKLDLDKLANIELNNGILGYTRAGKIMEELDKSKNVYLHEFFGSLGIKGLGVTNAKKLIDGLKSKYKIETVTDLMDTKLCECFHLIDGIGIIIADKISDGFNKFEEEIFEIARFMNIVKPTESKLGGKTFCITGTLSKPRKEFEKIIIDNGGEIKGFSKTLDYLIIGENPGSKVEKAKSTDINCLTEEQFFSLL